MGNYLDYPVTKVNKRSEKVTELRSVRALLEQFSRSNQSKIRLLNFDAPAIYTCQATFESEFSFYKVHFPTILEGAKFVLKHDLGTIRDILTGTVKALRKVLLNELEQYEIKRLKARHNADDV